MQAHSFIKLGLIAGLVMVTAAPVAGLFTPSQALAQADIRQEDRRADQQQDRQQDRHMDRQQDRVKIAGQIGVDATGRFEERNEQRGSRPMS